VAAGGSVDAEVAQKQKLECALQLIRTVVLDFNNALTSILGHSSLILSKMPPDHPWRNSLIEVEKSAERAAEVAQDLASFSRQEKDARAHATGNLNDLIQRTAALFRSSAPPGVQIVVSLERQVYAVKFEEAKMQQAILKVLDNAVQAIAANGQITVRTKNVDASEAFQDGSTRLPAGYYVSVEISDNGCGIPPDVQPRIFEPFFTTKGGQHRGLGLAWVYGIVTNHGGSVTVSSKPGDGTSVRLYLPAQKKFVKDRFGKQEDLMGHQTILMVDDEDMVLTMGETILSAFGYRVMTASSGPEALDLFAKHGAGIDLVITDMVMPQMSGRELVERLKSLNPALRIVCSSGYLRNVIEGESANYLKKPFTSQDLLRKVKQALE
jgi:nitrogen-specific signal transduction histidine kinase